MALPLALVTGSAFAANPCNPTVGVTSQYLASTVFAAGFSCEVGDKIFSNFTGSTANSSDTFSFNAQNPLTYSMNINAGNEFDFTGTFTFGFSVQIDPAVVILNGSRTSFSFVTGQISDATPNSTSTLDKSITANLGAPCTVHDVDNGANNGTGGSCSYGVGTTSLSVSETFTYTGGSNPSGVTGIGNTFGQSLSSTTGTPEPMSMLLFGSGLLACGFIGRKRLVRK